MMELDDLITKCLIGEEHLDQSEYEQVGSLLNELKILRKAYEMACDKLEFYERRMFPLAAISSAVFQISFLRSAEEDKEE